MKIVWAVDVELERGAAVDAHFVSKLRRPILVTPEAVFAEAEEFGRLATRMQKVRAAFEAVRRYDAGASGTTCGKRALQCVGGEQG